MRKLILFLSIFTLLSSCDQQEPCYTESIENKDYLKVKIVSFTGIGGFVANGYSTFEVLEVSQSFPTNYNDYYDSNIYGDYTSLKLPIAHNYEQTTFIFKGDTVAPETLRVNNYNAHVEQNSYNCFVLTIDKPNISLFTFAQKTTNPEFDENNKILKFQIIK